MAETLNLTEQAELDAAEVEALRIEEAIRRAVNETLLDHKRSGHPVVFADEQGNPVWVPADEIVIPALDEPKAKAKAKRRSKHDR